MKFRDSNLRLPRIVAPHVVARAAAIITNFASSEKGVLMIVAPDQTEADDLFELLVALAGAPSVRRLDAWDVLPFEPTSLDPAAAGNRVETLAELFSSKVPLMCVSSARAIARLTPSACPFHKISFSDEIPPARLRSILCDFGYKVVAEVSAPGEYAARGGLLDLHSPGLALPVRVEWDGDLIESIRTFDAETQRTVDVIDSVCIYPPRETILPSSPEGREEAIAAIEKAVTSSIRRDRLIDAIREGVFIEGLEVFQPFFGPQLSLFDLDARFVFVDEDIVRERIDEIYADAERESEESDLGYDPSLLWIRSPPAIKDAIRLQTFPESEVPVISIEPLPPAPPDSHILRTDVARLLARGDDVIVVTSMPQRVNELLTDDKLKVVEGNLMYGTRLTDANVSIIGDGDLFGRRRKKSGRGRSKSAIADWGALRDGEYVVHLHHGIGIFRGVERITSLGETRDVVLIEYAGGDKLYLPPHETNFVERYTIVEGSSPRLDKLGAAGWAKIRDRAARETAEIARELLDLYALRNMTEGVHYTDVKAEEDFARAFGYEETVDQARAIDEILSDLAKTDTRMPMDRLLCGDVGFGKTEVGLRAVFRVVRHGKQVAVLCPTTILALQHTETFRDRLEPFGISVGTLSRFQSPAEIKKNLAELEEGKLNVVIGTHKLLGSSVKFRDLGLVVIDEEQRFGVKHKEKFKALRKQADILTMTATPIPRTLHLALSGARSISLIETPPPGRAPVQTVVELFNEEHVRKAIRRELDRDGQVFYVHNRIETLDRIFAFLKKLFPNVTMEMAHGRMDTDDLASTMKNFLDGRTRILVSTAIVENGLDIPRANTMIVDGAERFGLSQLYQLRGRVGRSRVKAYAYFFHGPQSAMTEEARARLAAIAEHTALGAGYSIAHRDMEIRGAGEILGASQSGEMEAIGYDMYCRLLREAIDELRGKKSPAQRSVVVDLRLSAYLPFEWLGGEELVGAIHREISGAETVAAVDGVREALIDRFGQPPEPVENLLAIARLRAYAALDNVESIIESEHDISIRWRDKAPEREKHVMSFVPPLYVQIVENTAIIENLPKDRSRLEWIRRLLRR